MLNSDNEQPEAERQRPGPKPIRRIPRIAFDRDEFRQVGKTLFGDNWQTAMAIHYGLNSRTVRRWATGHPTPPPMICRALLDRLSNMGVLLSLPQAQRAAMLQRLAQQHQR